MTFGEDDGWGAPPAAHLDEGGRSPFAAFRDRGGNSIDTANVYTSGHSEAIIGDYLHTLPTVRDRIVLGTQFGSRRPAAEGLGGAVVNRPARGTIKRPFYALMAAFNAALFRCWQRDFETLESYGSYMGVTLQGLETTRSAGLKKAPNMCKTAILFRRSSTIQAVAPKS